MVPAKSPDAPADRLHMRPDSRSHYQSQAVETAGPAQLVLMLYDGALAALTRSEQALAAETPAGSMEIANRELQRAQDIVTELRVTLDLEGGGAIAANLAALYDFCLDRLITANVSKDPTELPVVRTVIADLREAWATACCAVTAAS